MYKLQILRAILCPATAPQHGGRMLVDCRDSKEDHRQHHSTASTGILDYLDDRIHPLRTTILPVNNNNNI